MVSKAKITPAHRVLQRAIFIALEYHHYDAARFLEALESWDSYTISVAIRRVIFISWEPLPLEFVNVSFNGSIHGELGNAGYII